MKLYKMILKQNLGRVIGVVLLGVLQSLAMVFAGYSLSFLFTAYEYKGDQTRALLYTFVIVLGFWLIAMGIYYLNLLSRAKILQKIKNDLRVMIGRKITSMEYAAFSGRDCGNYVSWLTNDVDQIYSQSFTALFTGIESLATTVFSFGALWLLSPYIGIAALVLLAVITVLPQLTGKHLQKANELRSEAMELSTERYKDVIMGTPVFFLNNLRERVCERIAAASRKAEQAAYRFNRTNYSMQMLISTVSMIAQVILVVVTLMAALMGTTPAGAALSVGNLAGSFFSGAADLVGQLMTVKASKPLWEKFESAAQTEYGTVVQKIPEIRLADVSFQYDDRPVLENRSYTFRSGGKYAVMGASGSGKTTLSKIILGLLPDYTGEVWYGALEQRDTDLESLYRHVAYVDQQVYLFQDTLRFNITLGREYSEREVQNVIRRCRLEGLVQSLPDGLDTMILENGKNLSGGQRQRIALARSLIRRVEYIILDEGTSALDASNAAEIESNLLDEVDLGVILITHNLRDCIRPKLTEIFTL